MNAELPRRQVGNGPPCQLVTYIPHGSRACMEAGAFAAALGALHSWCCVVWLPPGNPRCGPAYAVPWTSGTSSWARWRGF